METNSSPEHVTVDTCQVVLAGRDALNLLQHISGKYEEVALLPDTDGEGSKASLTFDLWIGGADTVHQVVLGADGTWSVRTHIEV